MAATLYVIGGSTAFQKRGRLGDLSNPMKNPTLLRLGGFVIVPIARILAEVFRFGYVRDWPYYSPHDWVLLGSLLFANYLLRLHPYPRLSTREFLLRALGVGAVLALSAAWVDYAFTSVRFGRGILFLETTAIVCLNAAWRFWFWQGATADSTRTGIVFGLLSRKCDQLSSGSGSLAQQ